MGATLATRPTMLATMQLRAEHSQMTVATRVGGHIDV